MSSFATTTSTTEEKHWLVAMLRDRRQQEVNTQVRYVGDVKHFVDEQNKYTLFIAESHRHK
jgi:hypothetical protein